MSKVNIDFLKEVYFTFDKPVDYQLKNETMIEIRPISVQDSVTFLLCVGILTIDKNSTDSIEIIQMSYLQYLKKMVEEDETFGAKLFTILRLCLGIEKFSFAADKQNRLFLVDLDNPDIVIGAKDFDEIKRIICYQNLLHYDDEYIPPDIKAAMEEVDEIKGRKFQPPTLERKFGIITAHTGISKKEQMDMTYRSHCVLFEEVAGEVEYMGIKAIATYGGKGEDVQWIYKKKQNKFDGYFTSDEKFNKSMGGNGSIKKTTVDRTES